MKVFLMPAFTVLSAVAIFAQTANFTDFVLIKGGTFTKRKNHHKPHTKPQSRQGLPFLCDSVSPWLCVRFSFFFAVNFTQFLHKTAAGLYIPILSSG
jgi:hypothetical protein